MPVRLRIAAATAAALACGVLPAAPLPAATAGPGVWAPTLAATGAFDNLSAFADGTMYASVGSVVSGAESSLPEQVPDLPGRADTPGYFKSTDFGRTWQPVPPPAHAGWSGTSNLYVRFATPHVGYATYNAHQDLPPDPTGRISPTLCKQLSSTFRTLDGGASWQPLCEPHLPDGSSVHGGPSPLAVGKDGNTVVLTGTIPTRDCAAAMPRGVVHFSADGGARWTRGLLPKGYHPGWSVRVHDRRTALVTAYKYDLDDECSGASTQNAVFLTTDGGRTYRKVLSCSKQPLCTAVAFVTRTTFLVGRTDGTTLVTRNAGRTWHPGMRLYDRANDGAVAGDANARWWFWVQSFSFTDSRHGFASTRGSGSWRTDDGGRSWYQERSHECTYHMWGVGENAAATADHAVTGGPTLFSVRSPAAASVPCTPSTASALPAAPDTTVAVADGLAVRADGSVTR
jgi:hypothetical protein